VGVGGGDGLGEGVSGTGDVVGVGPGVGLGCSVGVGVGVAGSLVTIEIGDGVGVSTGTAAQPATTVIRMSTASERAMGRVPDGRASAALAISQSKYAKGSFELLSAGRPAGTAKHYDVRCAPVVSHCRRVRVRRCVRPRRVEAPDAALASAAGVAVSGA